MASHEAGAAITAIAPDNSGERDVATATSESEADTGYALGTPMRPLLKDRLAQAEQWSWFVGIQGSDYQWRGGVLVAPTWVLTTAFCAEPIAEAHAPRARHAGQRGCSH